MKSLLGPEQNLVSGETIFKVLKTIENFNYNTKFSLLELIHFLLSLVEEVPVLLQPFVSPTAKIAQKCLDAFQKQSFLEIITIISLNAYLKSYHDFIEKDSNLLESIENKPVPEFKQHIEKIDMLRLEYDDTTRAVENCFHESKLAVFFGKVLLKRLSYAGLEKKKAEILTRRVAWNTPRYLYQSWTESSDTFKHQTTELKTQIKELFKESKQEQQIYRDVEDYLREEIASGPKTPVFDEKFFVEDIYVPLEAKAVKKNGKIDRSFDLKEWAINILDYSNSDRVMFVQAGPGRGKSIFCRMFADWVRANRYPLWIPVLIRLREIKTLHPKFEDTLQEAVSEEFAGNGWLRNRHTKYLFLLDGFDELLLEGRTDGLDNFLKKVAAFQQDSHRKTNMGHRVLITGRPLALQGIELQMPDNLERVRIEVMNRFLQQQWLDKWAVFVGTETANAFQEFLRDNRCPDRVKELAREPLLLYLLAAMHRDLQLQGSDFEGATGRSAKIRIYQKSLEWVLTKQRQVSQLRELTGHDEKDLRRILAEVGLCVVQLGGEIASVKAIESRLEQNDNAKALLKKAREHDGDNPLRNALTVFYLRKGSQEGSVEFVHKSFGEFLCAECIKEGLEAWTASAQPPWSIYDLLAYGALTPEIVEYLMGLLTVSKEFDLKKLFDRLSYFYDRWGKEEFIDVLGPENLPLRKMGQLRAQGIQQSLRQVDVYAGLNVMIILLELHRYARDKEGLKEAIVFYPCGKLNFEGEFDDPRLLFRIIGYSRCIGDVGFRETVGRFLSGANLSRADLSGTDLSGANLSRADLSGADLSGANLCRADLSGADLRDTNLSRADLSGADLSGANLCRAKLMNAYLSGAVLSGANLSRADFSGADLSRANLSGADLSGADLGGAVLSGADLGGANLSGADLSGADLSRADLSGADLGGADLGGANLSRADLSGAVLSGAVLSDEIFGDVRWNPDTTKWENVRGLETAVDIPEALRQHLGL